MKHTIFILFFLAMGFNCVAQNNKGISDNELNRIKKDLIKQVLNPMRETADQLEHEINNVQALINRLRLRKYNSTSTSTSTSYQRESPLEEYLSRFPSLKDMFDENEKTDGAVYEHIMNSDNSDLKSLYKLIFEMHQSLNEPYVESTNEHFIKEAVNNNALLPNHKNDKEFEKLVVQIEDYRYYMFELGRLLASKHVNMIMGGQDDSKTKVEALTSIENSEELMEIPFIYNILLKYFDLEFTKDDENMLYRACPDAFPNYKP